MLFIISCYKIVVVFVVCNFMFTVTAVSFSNRGVSSLIVAVNPKYVGAN